MAEIETRPVPAPEDVSVDSLAATILVDVDNRIDALRHKCGQLLRHPASRDVFAALIDLDESERYGLLRHVIRDTTGPGTLNGLEELARFVSYYVLDDGELVVVDDVDPEIDDVGIAAIMANHRALSDDAHVVPQAELDEYRKRERSKTLSYSAGDVAPARGEQIVEAIRFNRDFAARDRAAWEAAHASFMDEDSGSEGPRI